MTTTAVIAITAACFFAAILNLALKTGFKRRVMGVGSGFAICVGIAVYGYAYAFQAGLSASTVLRALLTVCRMFGGVNDFSAVSATPLAQKPWLVSLFWLAHFMAFYVTASAAIEVLGKRLLKLIRLRLARRGGLTLVYGATADSIRLVPPQRKGQALALVADGDSPALSDLAEAMNGVAFSGGAALCATPEFLKSIGVGEGRRLDVYCVGDDGARNLGFAEALASALAVRGVGIDQTSLFLLGVPEERAAHLIARKGNGGYGSVFASDRYALVARLAVRALPPWDCLTYDDEARATADFRAVIVGFGQMGRAMLRQYVMNGQMEGSAFQARVFDRRMDDLSGYAEACYPELLRAYDIALLAGDADSRTFYGELDACTPSVIALCCGSRKENAERALDLERFFATRAARPHILQCSAEAVVVDGVEHALDAVDVRGMDRRAMELNHVYCRGASAEADWRACDPFSRASSRASADFYPAFLRAAGVAQAEALDGAWPPEGATLENLARTEHLRWCAFHLAMGYRPMGEAEFAERAARYRAGEAIRLSKNAAGMTHACLTPWEQLDALSARENAVTGGHVDYKAMDVDNVLALTRVARAELEK